MTTFLPQDLNDNPIPALRLKPNGAHAISAGTSAARNASAFTETTRIVSLFANTDVFIACGDSSVTATSADHFFPAGVYYDIAIGGDNSAHYTHISVLQASSAGTVYISEKE